MTSKLLPTALLTILTVAIASGCRDSGGAVKTVKVSGAVYLDDKPLEGALVVFQSRKHTGIGKTDAKGRYTLEKGAVPGQNKVIFSKTAGAAPHDVAGPAASMPRVDPGKDTPPMAQGELLPEKYSNGLKPSVTFDVPEEGTREADFRLTSK